MRLAEKFDCHLRETVLTNFDDIKIAVEPEFSIDTLFSLIRKNVYCDSVTNKVVIIQWIIFLKDIPDIRIAPILTNFLAGIMAMFEEDVVSLNKQFFAQPSQRDAP